VTKRLLSPVEIQQFITLLRGVFAYISDLKDKNPLAADIQYPKLPSRLTESLAVHLLRNGVISELVGYAFEFGGREADVIGTGGQGRRRIEVKGTTKSFEYFGPKDIQSDYLLWFDFADLIKGRRENDHFKLYVLTDAKKYFTGPLKIDISKFEQTARDHLGIFDYRASSLLEQISKANPTLAGRES
jgi:hypothetical protein